MATLVDKNYGMTHGAREVNRDINPGSLRVSIDLLNEELGLLEKEIETLAQQVAPISVDRPTRVPPRDEENQGLSSPYAGELRALAMTVRKLRSDLVTIITQIDL